MLGIPNLARWWRMARAWARLNNELEEAKMVKGKKWWMSKSVWSAAAKIAAGLFAMLSPSTQGHVSEIAGGGLVVMGLFDGLLRVVTDKPLEK